MSRKRAVTEAGLPLTCMGASTMSKSSEKRNRRFSNRLFKLATDDNGAAAVSLALLSPVLIGGMALGAETGFWYYTQRKLQHAADVAAHAAGARKRAGDEGPTLKGAAVRVAQLSGFEPYLDYSTPNPTLVNLTVNDPPETGAYTGKSEAVEVSLFETHPRMLSSIFSKEPVMIGARAVARISGGTPACVLALSEASSRAVEVSGNSSATLNACGVAVNSVQPDAYYMPNSTAYLSADCISTVGGSVIKKPSPNVLSLKTCSSVQEQAPKTPDPYADVPEPYPDPLVNICQQGKNLKGTVSPDSNGIRCFNGLSLDSVTIEPGLYIINSGKLIINAGAVVNGQGVTFFLANNSTVELEGNAKINLSAPAQGNLIPATEPYAGLLFFGERCDPTWNPAS